MTLRRSFMKWGLGLAAGAATRSFAQGPAAKYAPMFPVEKGAQLRLLRWSGFIKADEEVWNANTKKFQDATGAAENVGYITLEDVRPKAALSAKLGAAPDLVLGWYDDAHTNPHRPISP